MSKRKDVFVIIAMFNDNFCLTIRREACKLDQQKNNPHFEGPT